LAIQEQVWLLLTNNPEPGAQPLSEIQVFHEVGVSGSAQPSPPRREAPASPSSCVDRRLSGPLTGWRHDWRRRHRDAGSTSAAAMRRGGGAVSIGSLHLARRMTGCDDKMNGLNFGNSNAGGGRCLLSLKNGRVFRSWDSHGLTLRCVHVGNCFPATHRGYAGSEDCRDIFFL
jgi:hypothetical protein